MMDEESIDRIGVYCVCTNHVYFDWDYPYLAIYRTFLYLICTSSNYYIYILLMGCKRGQFCLICINICVNIVTTASNSAARRYYFSGGNNRSLFIRNNDVLSNLVSLSFSLQI
mmetsp:Transcript_52669/g.58858  ORF Transcript_52669/g.58858 Transcript_52669/m.58858 type:complete len:113 (+) Transcript_52669:252-590(+)